VLLEIIGLLIALGAIAGFARGRGAAPAVVVTVALIGFLLITFVGGAIVSSSSSDARLAMHLLAWGWVGGVALFVRFVVGARRPSPTGSWICTNCHYTNGRHAILCEACKQPWTPPYQSST
jgi:hypothetical protein